MSDADPTSEASSAASPDVVSPPFLAELDSLISQQTLILKLQSDKEDSLRNLYDDMFPVFDKLRSEVGSTHGEWNCMLKRQSECSARITEEQALHRKMSDLVRDSQRLRATMLRRESQEDTEQIRKERDQLREDVWKEKELHHVTMLEVEALRRQLDEEKELHEETRLMRGNPTGNNAISMEVSSAASPDQTLMLELQSDKNDSVRTLYDDMYPVFDKLRSDWKGSKAESAQWNCLLKRQSDYSARITEGQALHRKMSDLVRDSQRLRTAMLRREMEQGTEQTRKERGRLRDDVRKEKDNHHVTMFEVEALRRQLDEEKKLHEETRLMREQQISKQNDKEKEIRELTLEVGRLRAQLSEERKLHKETRLMGEQLISKQNNKDKGLREVTLEVVELRAQLSEEKKHHEETRLARDQLSEQKKQQNQLLEVWRKKNRALLEEIWEWRDRGFRAGLLSREGVGGGVEKLSAELLNSEEMKNEIKKREDMEGQVEKLRAELLNREEMKSEIERLRVELLKKREDIREEINGEIKLEQAEQEKPRRVLLEQQAMEMRNSEQTTARD
ncbi:uncharacterized protein LAJ45_05175 [Morchella importuna]|uniref:uncharacterized protein n=1 Tax=Morchella importuna TaxID=1174673 RepID=UPI001E8D7591|nr:uncharacterized protein LAJ45_05175 [Morchella importuna]KAH8150992.1 hypothetical protein LAJ45_05175 [Morchella importuna]